MILQKRVIKYSDFVPLMSTKSFLVYVKHVHSNVIQKRSISFWKFKHKKYKH